LSSRIAKPATVGLITKMRKKPDKELFCEMVSIKLPMVPAKKLAVKFPKYQTPNISPTSQAAREAHSRGAPPERRVVRAPAPRCHHPDHDRTTLTSKSGRTTPG